MSVPLARISSFYHRNIANASAMHDGMELDELVDMDDTTLATLLDKHWFDSDCRAERRHVRMLQKRFEKSKNHNDREIWRSVLSVPCTGCLNLGQCLACHAQAV